jgi:hypothetical protein
LNGADSWEQVPHVELCGDGWRRNTCEYGYLFLVLIIFFDFRRLAHEHGGAAGRVNECVIVRAHDRSLPLKLRMFFSSNRAQKSFSAEENKEAAQDWESPKVK